MGALWIIQSSFLLFGTKLVRHQQEKLPNISGDLSVLSILLIQKMQEKVSNYQNSKKN